jgi:hypothetical protein
MTVAFPGKLWRMSRAIESPGGRLVPGYAPPAAPGPELSGLSDKHDGKEESNFSCKYRIFVFFLSV